MNPKNLTRVKLWGGPLDGTLMSVGTVNGKPPSSIELPLPHPIPDSIPEDGPIAQIGPLQVAIYSRTHTHPSHGLLPVYRFVKP